MTKSKFFLLLIGVMLVCLAASVALADEADRGQELRTLIGHVRTQQDQPLQKAIVYLKNTKSLVIKTYISDSDGSFRFPALSPNVDYEIYAEYHGARSDVKTVSAFDSRREVNITLKIKDAK
jgi:carboxypeptidase family protein